MKRFPKKFLWGAATSAFQAEGAFDVDGKGLAITDVRSFAKNEQQADTKIASDHYHHWKEDVKLMVELGLKSYRFSISWARILPNGDEKSPNENGVKFYNDLIDELIKNDIEPMITMYHFDQPMQLIEKYGGWVNDQSTIDFVHYGKLLIDLFSDRVKYWFTINEQSVLVLDYQMIGIEDNDQALQNAYQANLNMWLAQAEVIKYAKAKSSDILIGPAISYITTLPYSMSALDMLAAKELEDFYSFSAMDVAIKGVIPQYFLKELKKIGLDYNLTDRQINLLKDGKANFLGVNWYCSTIVAAKDNYYDDEIIFKRIERKINDKLLYTEWGWNCDPIALRYGLRELMHRYGDIPIAITECGWSSKDELLADRIHDKDRIDYLCAHIEQMQNSITDGVNLIAFHPWSFIDILSAGQGFEKRYGLVYVDRSEFDIKSLKRYKKDSYYYYQKVIADNAI
ncbi:MAG: glycoside hydrolase family 1 protein [Erysipelotrichaceae bacterium]